MADFLVQCPPGYDLIVTEAGLFPDPAEATDPVNADVFWRKVDEPFVSNKLLGTFRVGTDVDFHLPLASDTDVVLTTVTRGPRGQRVWIDASDAPQTIVRVPGIGGGTPSAFRIADEGTLLTQRGTLNFIGAAVTAVDNAGALRTDVTVTAGYPNFANQNLGVPPRAEINLPLPFLRAEDVNGRTHLFMQRAETGCYNAVTDLNCSADPRYYKANFSAGSTAVTILAGQFWDDAGTLQTLPDPYYHEGTVHTFRTGQGVRLPGAGVGGADLFTTLSAVSGNVLTLAVAPSGNGAPGQINHDETSAVQSAINLKRRVHFPTGRYLIYSELRFPQTLSGNYDGLEIKGDGERNTIFLISHTGHGFRMDQAYGGGGLVHLRMSDIGIFAVERANKDDLQTTSGNAGLAFTCTAISGSGVPEGDTTDFKLERLFIQGFGYGILGQNTQTGYLGHITVWYHRIAGIALIGNNDDLGTSQKEPNAVLIQDSFCQYGDFIPDSKITGTGTISAQSRTLSMAGVSLARIGCVIKIAGAGVGGRAHVTFIENISGSTITISMPTYTASSAADNVTILATNVANIYLHNANNVSISGGTHQGNWDNNFAAAVNDACGVRAEALTSLRIDNLWYEDTGGEDGASIDLQKTRSVFISGCHVGGAKKSEPSLPSGHGVGVRCTNTDGVEITGTYFGQSGTGVWLQLNERCKGTRVSASVVPGPEMYNNTGDFCEPAVLADSCTMPTGLDLNRNSERLLDDLWGQALSNPRFLDRSGSNPVGWTVVNTAFTLEPSAQPTAWLDRFQAYMTVNTQGQAASGEGDIVTQTVSIPDSDPACEYVLSFDARMTSRGAGSGTNDFQSVALVCNLTGSSYPDSSQYFPLFGSSSVLFWLNRWQRYHLRVRVGLGTGRTLRVAISACRGAGAPIVQYANFRLQRGRASTHDADGVVSERGGVVRAPLDFAQTTAPPVSAAGRISMANISGALSISVNGAAYTPVGGGGTGLQSLNGQTGQTQTFAAGVTGNDFNISSAADLHTFNLPSATTTARGAVTTTAQTFGGYKTFNDGAASTQGLDHTNVSTAYPQTAPANTARLAFSVSTGWQYSYNGSAYQAFGVQRINGKSGLVDLVLGTTATGGGPGIDNNSQPQQIILNLPDAELSVRGLVSTANQTFGGFKFHPAGLSADYIFLGAAASYGNAALPVGYGALSFAPWTVGRGLRADWSPTDLYQNVVTVQDQAAGGAAWTAGHFVKWDGAKFVLAEGGAGGAGQWDDSGTTFTTPAPGRNVVINQSTGALGDVAFKVNASASGTNNPFEVWRGSTRQLSITTTGFVMAGGFIVANTSADGPVFRVRHTTAASHDLMQWRSTSDTVYAAVDYQGNFYPVAGTVTIGKSEARFAGGYFGDIDSTNVTANSLMRSWGPIEIRSGAKLRMFAPAGVTSTEIGHNAEPAQTMTWNLPQTAPTAGQVLTAVTSSGGTIGLGWATAGGSVSGTLNRLALFTASNTIGDSHLARLYDSVTDTYRYVFNTAAGLEWWRDATPTQAYNLSWQVPGVAKTNDLRLSHYNGSAWSEVWRATTAREFLVSGAGGTILQKNNASQTSALLKLSSEAAAEWGGIDKDGAHYGMTYQITRLAAPLTLQHLHTAIHAVAGCTALTLPRIEPVGNRMRGHVFQIYNETGGVLPIAVDANDGVLGSAYGTTYNLANAACLMIVGLLVNDNTHGVWVRPGYGT
jgi:hypothetical protein